MAGALELGGAAALPGAPDFRLARGPFGLLHLRSDLELGAFEEALRRLREGGLKVLKEDRKASVFAGLRLGGRPLCLKVYRRSRRGRRGFRNLRLLQAQGVPVAEPYFLWERPRREGGGAVLGMEDLAPRPELDRWLAARLGGGDLERSRRSLRPLFRSLGALLRGLHDRGLYLDDLKTCNIFLELEGREATGEGARFRFVDVDGARLRAVGLWLRARNLAQLNRSVPLAAGLGCRMAFWREYRRGLDRSEARRLRRRAVERSARRPVLYVAAEGVREEPWPARLRDWPR